MSYLIDSSALWRIRRDAALAERWVAEVSGGSVRSCEPQRAEFRRSSRNTVEFDEFNDQFVSFPDAALPKGAWRWIDAAQRRLVGAGVGRALSVVDLLVCATAAHHGLTVLHDDNDFETVARHLPDVRELRITAT